MTSTDTSIEVSQLPYTSPPAYTPDIKKKPKKVKVKKGKKIVEPVVEAEPTVEPDDDDEPIVERTPTPPPAFDIGGLVRAMLTDGERGARAFVEDREPTPPPELVLATNLSGKDIHYTKPREYKEERVYRRAPAEATVVEALVERAEQPTTYKLSTADRKKMSVAQLIDHELTCLREFVDCVGDGNVEAKMLEEFNELTSYTSKAKIFPAHLESRTDIIDELVQLRYAFEYKWLAGQTDEKLVELYRRDCPLDDTGIADYDIVEAIRDALGDLDKTAVFGRLNDGSKTDGGDLLRDTIGVHHKGLVKTIIAIASQIVEGDPPIVAGLTYRPHTRTYYIRSSYYKGRTLKPMDLSPHLQYSMLSLSF